MNSLHVLTISRGDEGADVYLFANEEDAKKAAIAYVSSDACLLEDWEVTPEEAFTQWCDITAEGGHTEHISIEEAEIYHKLETSDLEEFTY